MEARGRALIVREQIKEVKKYRKKKKKKRKKGGKAFNAEVKQSPNMKK